MDAFKARKENSAHRLVKSNWTLGQETSFGRDNEIEASKPDFDILIR